MSRFLIALCLSLSIEARASQANTTVELSIEQALQRAEAASPIMARARAARQVVEGRRVGAAVLLPANPWLSFAGGVAQEPGLPNGSWLAGHLEQSIEIAGQRGARIREVAAAVKVAGSRERFALVETRALVRTAYVGALLAERYLEIARRRAEAVGGLLGAVKARLDLGAATEIDLHLAEIEYGRVTAEAHDAQLAWDERQADLRLLVDVPPDAALKLTSALPVEPSQLPAVRDLIDAATSARADLKALVETAVQIDREISRWKREVVPNPSLFIDVQKQYPNQLYIGGGVAIAMPLWRRNQGEIALARAERLRHEVELTVSTREVAREVDLAYRTVEQRRKQALLFSESIVPAADKNVELVTTGWRSGKFDLYRVMVANREAAEAHRAEISTVSALWQALFELDRATGKP